MQHSSTTTTTVQQQDRQHRQSLVSKQQQQQQQQKQDERRLYDHLLTRTTKKRGGDDMRADRCPPKTASSWPPSYYPPGILGDEMRELERRFLTKEDYYSLQMQVEPSWDNHKTKKQRFTTTTTTMEPTAIHPQLTRSNPSAMQRLTDQLLRNHHHRPPNGTHHTNVLPVAEPSDANSLTTYQTLVRASLEYFTAVDDDVNTSVQGRRQRIVKHQLGIRCKHCSHLPVRARTKAAVYYPKSIMSLYQGAQTIANIHFPICQQIPKTLTKQIETERVRRSGEKSGGRPYWAEMCRKLGIYESDEALWLRSSQI